MACDRKTCRTAAFSCLCAQRVNAPVDWGSALAGLCAHVHCVFFSQTSRVFGQNSGISVNIFDVFLVGSLQILSKRPLSVPAFSHPGSQQARIFGLNQKIQRGPDA